MLRESFPVGSRYSNGYTLHPSAGLHVHLSIRAVCAESAVLFADKKQLAISVQCHVMFIDDLVFINNQDFEQVFFGCVLLIALLVQYRDDSLVRNSR